MKKKYLASNKFSICLSVLFLGIGLPASSGQTQYCTSSNSRIVYQDGYRYEVFNEQTGTGCMTIGGNNQFEGLWQNSLNYLSSKGVVFSPSLEHQEIGRLTAFYNCEYKPQGVSSFGIYGSTIYPFVEYFIIENWNQMNPSASPKAVSHGIYKINGVDYEIVTIDNEKTISDGQGVHSVTQCFSIRQHRADRGAVPIDAHFNVWESIDVTLGRISQVSFAVEGFKCSGSFNFSKSEFTFHLPFQIQNTNEALPKSKDESEEGNSINFLLHPLYQSHNTTFSNDVQMMESESNSDSFENTNKLNSTDTDKLNEANSNPFSIYPNPSTGAVTIDLNTKDTNANIRIMDSSGKLVFRKDDIKEKKIQIPCLERGIYIVNVSDKNNNASQKLVVQ